MSNINPAKATTTTRKMDIPAELALTKTTTFKKTCNRCSLYQNMMQMPGIWLCLLNVPTQGSLVNVLTFKDIFFWQIKHRKL